MSSLSFVNYAEPILSQPDIPMNNPSSFSLTGKVILLTGGAGLYGRGLAAHLARSGATLVLASRNVEALQVVAEEEGKLGHTVHAKALDQSSEASILKLRDSIMEEFGRVDGFVNNAVSRPMTRTSSPLSEWEDSMKTNATGMFAISRAFADVMADQGHGSIVNIGSIQGMIGPDLSLYEGLGMEVFPDYFFHKGGMINLTRFLAAHYGPSGVRVNCLSPGGFFNEQSPTFVERYTASTFLRRMADNDDLSGPVIFLLSEAARYVTGVNLPVDGGYTAR